MLLMLLMLPGVLLLMLLLLMLLGVLHALLLLGVLHALLLPGVLLMLLSNPRTDVTTTDKPSGRPRTRTLPSTALTERLAQTRQRLKLTQPRMALYLGVPTATYQSWEMGLRDPSASVLRLLDVLGLIEALAPGVHAELMP